MKDPEPFYKDGLNFTCQTCSKCCRHDPGYVFLSKTDVTKMAGLLRVAYHDFLDTYCRSIEISGIPRISLTEKENYDCIFWDQGKCTVYQARPLQCRSFPFWPGNLINETTWKNAGKECPGIGKGKKHSGKKIEKWLAKRETEPFLVSSQ